MFEILDALSSSLLRIAPQTAIETQPPKVLNVFTRPMAVAEMRVSEGSHFDGVYLPYCSSDTQSRARIMKDGSMSPKPMPVMTSNPY